MPDERIRPVLEAARVWKETCLLERGSILSERSLWNEPGFQELHRYFIERPDEGEGDFFQKLEKQLEPAAPVTKQLAAEILWLMYLPLGPSSMRGSTKRDHIRRVWKWSGAEFPESSEFLGDVMERGTIVSGTSYHTFRWKEFAFACQAFAAWLALDDTAPSRLEEPWAFAEWLDAQPSSEARQLRHLLLYMLFPDDFEPIPSLAVKKKLLLAFGEDLPKTPTEDGAPESFRLRVDQRIHAIRSSLEVKQGEGFSFYESPVREMWFEPAQRGPASAADLPGTDEELAKWFRDRFGDVQAWIFSPGRRGVHWPEFFDKGIAAMGWDGVGDLSTVASREEAYDLLVETGLENPMNDSLALWEFSHEIQPGDVILAKSGRNQLHGYGVVQGAYRYEPDRDNYHHVVPVNWKLSEELHLESGHGLAVKTLTRANDFLPYVARLMKQLEDHSRGPAAGPKQKDDPSQAAYTVEAAMRNVFLSRKTFESIRSALRRKKNVILQGPPGVGKSFLAKRLAWALIGFEKISNVEMVQFHQSYAYEDFVQGFRPTENGGFALRDGIFLQFCDKARQRPDETFVMIIDEINRGNLSRIFGELLLLLEGDKRGSDHELALTYSPETRFSVPENVHVLGLMNTADRSLAMVDYALRRRFAFFRIPPAFGSEAFRTHLLEAGADSELVDHVDECMRSLNEAISEDRQNLGSGFAIGHSFFVPTDDDVDLDDEWFRSVIETDIGPLLSEYFFDEPEKVDEYLAMLRR